MKAAELLKRLEALTKEIAAHEVQVGEEKVKTVEQDLADVTQLSVAVHRLELFLEHLGQFAADEPVRQAHIAGDAQPDQVSDDDDLDSLTRKELDARAAELGLEEPEKLANKDAVIEAIEAAQEDDEDDEE